MSETLTYQWFRSRGFRFDSSHLDSQPHMVLVFGDKLDRSLEVAPRVLRVDEWIVWLRSDISHNRGRFVFVREATQSSQVEALYLALTDRQLLEAEWDPQQFEESLNAEREDCQRRWEEYVKNQRYSCVPG